jgi:hypothetical protein
MKRVMKAVLFSLVFAASPAVLAKGGGGGHGGGGHSSGGHASAHVSTAHVSGSHVAPAAKSSGSLFGGWSFWHSKPAPVVVGRSTSSCKDQQGNPCK